MIEGENSGYLKEKIAQIAAQNTFAVPPVTEHYDVSIYIPPDIQKQNDTNNSTAIS